MNWSLLLLLCAIILLIWAAWQIFHTAQSATLQINGGKMPATILVGGTATASFLEWTGPAGTGSNVAPVGTVVFASDNAAVATVDPSTGIATGVSAGTANISGTDGGNGLTASDVLTVTAAPPPVAQSATLELGP